MTFLELVQQVAEESGTVDIGNLPSAVTGQTGRNLRFVNWTKRAWDDIQRSRGDWLWLVTTMTGATSDGVRYYSSADSRFAEWIVNDASEPFTLYETSEGLADEGRLTFLRWEDFRDTALVGTARSGKPAFCSIDPANQIALDPVPDATGYTLRGHYRKGPQTLAADADEPEMPARFHEMIVWRALVRMAIFDENDAQAGAFQALHDQVKEDLLASQTARVTLSGALGPV